MVYKIKRAIRIIHNDGLDKLLGDTKYTISVSGDINGASIYNGGLPVRIEWRVKVYDEKEQIVSCIGEGYYLLLFEYEEHNSHEEIIDLIDASYSIFFQEWEKIIQSTPLKNNLLPVLEEGFKTNATHSILHAARQAGLLK